MITFGIHQRMNLQSIDRYIKYDRYSDMWIYPGSDNCKVVQVQQVQPSPTNLTGHAGRLSLEPRPLGCPDASDPIPDF